MTLYEDVQRQARLIASQPYRPHTPLLSPHCGLHDEHAPACRSAICECTCHYEETR